MLCSDKTGTLTQNKLTLGEPFAVSNVTAAQVILSAALASRADDDDAIDLAVLGGLDGGQALHGYQVTHFQQTVTYHSVPLGEVEIRCGEPIHATDGDIGRVQGLVIDRGNHYVTHVLLQEGHLRGRKEVAIPVSAVASTGDGIQLTITKQEVRDLPPADIDHPTRAPAAGRIRMTGQDTGWAPGFAGHLRVKPGSTVRLPEDFDPGERFGLHKKKDGARLLQRGAGLLTEYQRRLAAPDTWGVLVVLQAIDAGGKDGTIRHVMSGVKPARSQRVQFQGAVRGGTRPRLPVAARPPAARPGADRHLQQIPLRGSPRRAGAPAEPGPPEAPPAGQGRRRVEAPVPGDQRLGALPGGQRHQGGQAVPQRVQEEQRTRFLKRIDRPEKNWKFSASDARERRYWDDYQRAHAEMLTHTSTGWAPWHVLPADHRWFTRICAAAVIAATLIEIGPRYPSWMKPPGGNSSGPRPSSRPRRRPEPLKTPPRRGSARENFPAPQPGPGCLAATGPRAGQAGPAPQ